MKCDKEFKEVFELIVTTAGFTDNGALLLFGALGKEIILVTNDVDKDRNVTCNIERAERRFKIAFICFCVAAAAFTTTAVFFILSR